MAALDLYLERNRKEATELMKACGQGNAERVKQLLQKGADINAGDTDGDTALMYAAQSGHTEIVKVLAELGADINTANKTGKYCVDCCVSKRAH